MKLFSTQAFHKRVHAPTEKRLCYSQKAAISSFGSVYSRSSAVVGHALHGKMPSCVSRSDETLPPVDISHRTSTSRLEELVHSVICQQVLRLCQKRRYKRRSSDKETLSPKKRQMEGELTGSAASPAEPAAAASS